VESTPAYCGNFNSGFVEITSKQTALKHIQSAIDFQKALGTKETYYRLDFPEAWLKASDEKLQRLMALQAVVVAKPFAEIPVGEIIKFLERWSGLYGFQKALASGEESSLKRELPSFSIAQELSGDQLLVFLEEVVFPVCQLQFG
jgi:hypothetical protein